MEREDKEEGIVYEKILRINRISKGTKGGRRLRFNVLAVVGSKKGSVGYGLAKGNEVSVAIQKAIRKARKSLQNFSFSETIPHSVIGKFGASKIMLRPAKDGKGIIAGAVVRSVMEAIGIKDIVTKSIGSSNPVNVVKATLAGLRDIKVKKWKRERG